MYPDLYVVTPIFNPRRYASRYKLYKEFAKHVKDSGAHLLTVEIALGERSHCVTEAKNPSHLQLRSNDEWFIKENLINLGLRELLPAEAKYVAWVDADVHFLRHDWVRETVEMLQHHPVVQMFSQVVNLNPKGRPFQMWHSFAHSFVSGRAYAPIGTAYYPNAYWHPGFAWAFRREFVNRLGGMMDRVVLGSADCHMAAAFIGKCKDTIHGKASNNFHDYVFDWENNAQRSLRQSGDSLGCVDGTIGHNWHGRMKDRKYKQRWDILVEHDYDPYADLRPDIRGLLHLTDRSPGLRTDIQRYLANRDEDCIYFDESETTLGE